jgi:FAD synthase
LFGNPPALPGRTLEVFFVKKLRAERRFAGPEALRRQIAGDIKKALKILATK